MVATSPLGVLLGQPVTTNFLVDSGADLTMIDSSYAVRLGIDLSSCPIIPIQGVGGSTQGRQATIKMLLCGQWLNVPVVFSANQEPQLLGRAGVFDNLLVAFAHGMKTFLAGKM